MGYQYSVFKFRYFCPIKNKFLTTRYKTTKELAEKAHPDAKPLLDTEEVRELPEDLFSNTLGRFYAGHQEGDVSAQERTLGQPVVRPLQDITLVIV